MPELRFTPTGNAVISLYLLLDDGVTLSAYSGEMDPDEAERMAFPSNEWRVGDRVRITGEWQIRRNNHQGFQFERMERLDNATTQAE